MYYPSQAIERETYAKVALRSAFDGAKRVSFMYSLAAAGGALLLRLDLCRNTVLGTAVADDVRLHGGGSPGTGAMTLDVTDGDAMKARWAERSHPHFMRMIRDAGLRRRRRLGLAAHEALGACGGARGARSGRRSRGLP